MISNLKTKFLYLVHFCLMSGCASIGDWTEKKQADLNVLVGWESAGTSTIYRSSDQGQSFVNWYYRREPGTVKVLACQSIFSVLNQVASCKTAGFPNGGPQINNLVWVPNLGNGSHGGPTAWISFYRRNSESINFTASEQIVCAAVYAGDVSCGPSTTLPQ